MAFNRPLRKLAEASEIRHQAFAANLRSHVVHEDPSTALMPNFTASVEFPKRSIVTLLINDQLLPEKNRDHALINDWQSYRESHIKPDWLLIYKKYDNKLLLARTGTHSELF